VTRRKVRDGVEQNHPTSTYELHTQLIHIPWKHPQKGKRKQKMSDKRKNKKKDQQI
jgi:hypothetical protein